MSSKHGRNAGKKSRDGQGKKKRDRHPRRHGLVSFETLETRDLLSATLFDEGVDRFVMSTDVKPSIGTIGTPDQPVVTYTGGLAAYTSGLTSGYSRDLDQIPFTLATTGNASSKIRVQFTPNNFDGNSPVVATVVSNANGTSTATLSNMFQVGNTTNSSGIRLSDGTTVVTATHSFPDSKTIEWSLNGLAAGSYRLSLKTADILSFLPLGIGRSVGYTYEAVFQSFAVAGGTPDAAKPLGAQSPEPDLTSAQGRIGIAQYAAGRIDGSSAPGNFTNDPAETVGYWPAEGLTIVNLFADAGSSRIGNPNINLIDANGFIQFAGPTTTTPNRFTWVLPILLVPVRSTSSFSRRTTRPARTTKSSLRTTAECYRRILPRMSLRPQTRPSRFRAPSGSAKTRLTFRESFEATTSQEPAWEQRAMLTTSPFSSLRVATRIQRSSSSFRIQGRPSIRSSPRPSRCRTAARRMGFLIRSTMRFDSIWQVKTPATTA